MDFAMYYKNQFQPQPSLQQQQAKKYLTNWKADVIQYGVTIGGSMLVLKLYYDKAKGKKNEENINNQLLGDNDAIPPIVEPPNNANADKNQQEQQQQQNQEKKRGLAGLSEHLRQMDNYIREQEKRKMEEFFGKK